VGQSGAGPPHSKELNYINKRSTKSHERLCDFVVRLS
jgi:hypothetical protein